MTKIKGASLILIMALLSACGSKSKDRSDAPHQNGPTGSHESLGEWERLATDIGANLNSISYVFDTGVIAVGDGGTVIVSTDEGKTWSLKDVGTTSNLNKIAWVNNVVYIGGDDIVLMSTDNGNSFVRAGNADGKIRDIVYTSSNSKPGTFWAVGDDGLALKASIGGDLEDFNPETLAWENVSVPDAGNLTGVTFSFDAGLIVGERGFVAETSNGGDSFGRVTSVSTTADLLAIDNSEFIGGVGVVLVRGVISGMPVGAYKWTQHESSDLPTIRGLACIGDCLAVGSTASGSTIFTLDEEGKVTGVEASSIRGQLNAVTWGPGRHLAAGSNGTVLQKKKKK